MVLFLMSKINVITVRWRSYLLLFRFKRCDAVCTSLPVCSTPAQAKEYYLACVIPPDDEDWARDALTFFCKELSDKPVQINVEYKIPGQQQVSSEQ